MLISIFCKFVSEHIPLGGNVLSPLKYKKKYLIKNPLKPRRLNLIQKSRYKRKNKSAKREINGNVELNQKYIPLLKSLRMLFDNLLDSDSSESYELKTKKYKRNRFYSEETLEIPHNTHQSDSEITESESQEEAVTFSPTRTTTISTITETPTTTETASTTANIITARDFSAFRQNKNISVLLPRNTSSGRRDDNGHGERSGTALHGNIKGNFTGYHGDHEHDARCGENDSCAEHDDQNTLDDTRNGARDFRLRGPTRNRNNTGLSPRRNNIETSSQTETTEDNNRENQLETGRNETESGGILQEPIGRLRGFISSKDIKNTESVQPKEVPEESVVDITYNNAGYQQFTDGGSTITKEIEKVRTGIETMMTMNVLNFTTRQSNTPKKKAPVMMIFDGYSSVKHKNGQNKIAEKSIRIHS